MQMKDYSGLGNMMKRCRVGKGKVPKIKMASGVLPFTVRESCVPSTAKKLFSTVLEFFSFILDFEIIDHQ